MRKLSILGSTGSIGRQTLEVARKAPEDFTVEALTCDSDIETLYEQIVEFRPRVCSVVYIRFSRIRKDSIHFSIPLTGSSFLLCMPQILSLKLISLAFPLTQEKSTLLCRL